MKIRTHIILLLTIVLAIGCATEDAVWKAPEKTGQVLSVKRAKLLARCPAKAPTTERVQEALARDRGLNRVVWEDPPVTDHTYEVVTGYVKQMPRNERVRTWLDHVNNRIVVQVTKKANKAEVLSDLRSQVQSPEEITIETVRYSDEELAKIAKEIEAIPELGRFDVNLDGYSDNSVVLYVPGDAEQTRKKILASGKVGSCSFRVEGDSKPMLSGSNPLD